MLRKFHWNVIDYFCGFFSCSNDAGVKLRCRRWSCWLCELFVCLFWWFDAWGSVQSCWVKPRIRHHWCIPGHEKVYMWMHKQEAPEQIKHKDHFPLLFPLNFSWCGGLSSKIQPVYLINQHDYLQRCNSVMHFCVLIVVPVWLWRVLVWSDSWACVHKLLVSKLHIIMGAPDLQVNKCHGCYKKFEIRWKSKDGWNSTSKRAWERDATFSFLTFYSGIYRRYDISREHALLVTIAPR